MGSYAIPNNKLKGEGRFLVIFTTKSLIFTAAGALLGTPIYLILSILGYKSIGLIIIAILALIGYLTATIKFPQTTGKVGRYLAGDTLDEIIIKYIKFKKSRKIYSYAIPRKEPTYSSNTTINFENILGNKTNVNQGGKN